MIVQSTPVILKQRNQVNRECLYAWYPEVVTDTSTTTSMGPRDIYIHKGIDKDLIQQNSPTNGLINGYNNNNSNNELLQRYGQSMAPSERIYHSAETLDEALRTPWALHYEIQRRPATPNPPSHSTDTTRKEMPRRLKSAPVVRSFPLTSVLAVPEPRLITPIIPVTTNEIPRSPLPTRPRTRASSAKARLNTTFPTYNEPIEDNIKQQRREIKSAQAIRSNDETKLSDEENQKGSTQFYSDVIQQQQQEPPSIPLTPTPPPTNGYQKPVNYYPPNEPPPTPIDKKLFRSKTDFISVPPNLHYIHRPGVISVTNIDKPPIVRENSASRKSNKHIRRHHRHHREKRHEPLLALTPMTQSVKIPVEIDGIKLIYDPSLTLDDPSLNLTKYFIEGRLYLIKGQHYNVLENIDPTMIEKYNQNLTLPQRPKYYQTIPVEKFQVPKPPPEFHFNASETYFYNTLPKRLHRYVVDPNFISENLNVNKISMSKRPLTATVVHSTINDINRQQTTPTTVYT
ncbi:unnamed protein product [Rotaria sp. Silwood1]|nr:unnamed protein product [Rotaria sp. Silwood1]CAF4518869.1 unnamed protein product [Rotaria sp. Silwood1]CAF4592718.1 unnamed protein product [Rotaria sp. Silwood1]